MQTDYDTYDPQCSISSWTALSPTLEKNKFSILSMNIRSMHNKFSELKAHLACCKVKFSFIILTETWVVKKNDYNFDIEGYKCASLYRNDNQRGGGIKLFYREDLPVTVITEKTGIIPDCCEQLFIESMVPGVGKVIVGAIYRPPHLNASNFCQNLDNLLSSIGNVKSLILGDININTLNNSNDPTVQNYLDTLAQNGFVNEIDKATYLSPITNTDISCSDHILTNIKINKQTKQYNQA